MRIPSQLGLVALVALAFSGQLVRAEQAGSGAAATVPYLAELGAWAASSLLERPGVDTALRAEGSSRLPMGLPFPRLLSAAILALLVILLGGRLLGREARRRRRFRRLSRDWVERSRGPASGR